MPGSSVYAYRPATSGGPAMIRPALPLAPSLLEIDAALAVWDRVKSPAGPLLTLKDEPVTTFVSNLRFGQTVFLDDPDGGAAGAIEMIITGFSWQEPFGAPKVEVSWMHAGTHHSEWFPSWRLTPADDEPHRG